jgi:hypothetical protein
VGGYPSAGSFALVFAIVAAFLVLASGAAMVIPAAHQRRAEAAPDRATSGRSLAVIGPRNATEET